MYEELEKIAALKFGKEMDSISAQTRERVREMQNEYAARSGVSGSAAGSKRPPSAAPKWRVRSV